MYKTRKKVYFLVINAAVLLLSVFVSVLLVQKDVSDKSPVIFAAVPALVFLMLLIAGSSIRHGTDKLLRKKYLESGETAYIDEFIERLRFCYSYEDLYKAFAEILEIKADCSVLLIDREKNYVLYNSPNRISSYSETREKLFANFPAQWEQGFYFLGDKLGIVSNYRQSRGFFVCYENIHCFIFFLNKKKAATQIIAERAEPRGAAMPIGKSV